MTTASPSAPNLYSLPFVEPHTATLLVVGSFLYLLNAIHELFQLLFGVGLVGQLILGAVYCIPLGNILPIDIQTYLGTIGYWGLLLLIVEGGFGTRFDILTERRNLALCVLVAFTGLCIPIGLSMVALYFGYRYAALESFIIGAALSVTSLGTTIAIMSSFCFPTPTKHIKNDSLDQCQTNQSITTKQYSYIGETRAGTILMGAAVIDDTGIPGLVISSVVGSIGTTNPESQVSAWAIARPIVSSIAILSVTVILAKYISPLFVALLPPKAPRGIPEGVERPRTLAPVSVRHRHSGTELSGTPEPSSFRITGFTQV